MIRFHLDECVAHAVANGLIARGVDVTTSTQAKLVAAFAHPMLVGIGDIIRFCEGLAFRCEADLMRVQVQYVPRRRRR